MRTPTDAFEQGATLMRSGDWKAGLEIFDRLAEFVPDDSQILSNLGVAHGQTGNPGTAMALLAYAAALNPEDAMAWGNLGATFQGGLHREYKRMALQKAAHLDPKAVAVWGNLAGSYVQDGNPEPGIQFALRCLRGQPTNPSARSNLALLLMELGRWREAWPHWPARWELVGGTRRTYAAPDWNGEQVASLLVHGEQGLGDEVMFLSYVNTLLERVSQRLVLEVNARLVPLVRRSWVDRRVEVIAEESELAGEVEAKCALGDLPGLLTPDAPLRVTRYLQPDPARVKHWQQWMATQGPRPWVAFAVHGGVKHTHELTRNPPREAWAPVVAQCGSAYGIQYGPQGAQRDAEAGVRHMPLPAGDLAEQAAFLTACDALVSVPQTALHIAGAVGAKVLAAISDKPAWRYGLTGSMPWYSDNVTLFRMAKGDGWGPVMDKISGAVGELPR